MEVCIDLYWCFSNYEKIRNFWFRVTSFCLFLMQPLRTLYLLTLSVKTDLVIFILLSTSHPVIKVLKKNLNFFKAKNSSVFSENFVFLNRGKYKGSCKVTLKITMTIDGWLSEVIYKHEFSHNSVTWSQADLFGVCYLTTQ